MFFISFEPSSSSVLVAAPDHRTWALLYVNVQTSEVVDLGCLFDSVPLLRTRCVDCVVYVRLMYTVIVQAIYIHYIQTQIGNTQHNRKLLSYLSLTTTLLLEITALLRHFTTVYSVHHFTQLGEGGRGPYICPFPNGLYGSWLL